MLGSATKSDVLSGTGERQVETDNTFRLLSQQVKREKLLDYLRYSGGIENGSDSIGDMMLGCETLVVPEVD